MSDASGVSMKMKMLSNLRLFPSPVICHFGSLPKLWNIYMSTTKMETRITKSLKNSWFLIAEANVSMSGVCDLACHYKLWRAENLERNHDSVALVLISHFPNSAVRTRHIRLRMFMSLPSCRYYYLKYWSTFAFTHYKSNHGHVAEEKHIPNPYRQEKLIE